MNEQSRINCGRKNRYDSKKDAVTAINFRMKHHNRRPDKGLKAYPCPHCGGWHITKA